MFINEQIRKCATFLYVEAFDEQSHSPKKFEQGTAFFVSKALDESDSIEIESSFYYPDPYVIYVVTAGHVITMAETETIYIRLNRDKFHLEECEEYGNHQDIATHKNDWIFHPKPNSTDVAVYRLVLAPGHFDIRTVPFATLVTKAYTAREGIGTGDEVSFIGLFTGHPGRERVEPVIRFGNISLMLPNETIDVYLSSFDQTTTPISAYLVEARSWGGQSGSPVFIYFPPLIRGQRYTEAAMRYQQLPLLLGLVHGQYEDDIPSPEASRNSLVSAGIAIVIPADKIRETIMQKKLADERREILEQSPNSSSQVAVKPLVGTVGIASV